jgi:hypothetical protein
MMEHKLYQEDAKDGFLSSIGSGNQKIWDIKYYREHHTMRGFYMEELVSLRVGKIKNDLIFYVKKGVI